MFIVTWIKRKIKTNSAC